MNMINPVGLLDIFISFLGFGNVHLFFQSFMERKLANNFTALFHASGCVAMTLLYFKDKSSLLHYIIKKFSSGYFLYDTLHTIKYRDFDILSFLYVYHHIATSYYIHQNPLIYRTLEILAVGELSNIPSYYVYYLLKNSDNSKLLKQAKRLQFLIYSFIRLPIASYLTYSVFQRSFDKRPIYIILPIYFMGLSWTHSLYKKL